MQIQVLLFGIIADLIGEKSIGFSISNGDTVSNFKEKLSTEFPQLKSYNNYVVAINETYATDETVVLENDIIALIPPVSGG